MRLHTSLTSGQVHQALRAAQESGKVTGDIRFAVFRQYGSRTHPRSFEVQLGTWDKHSLPAGTTDQHGKRMRVRKFKNSGSHGAHSGWATGEDVWAATWHEWGWFMAAVFAADPGARFGGLKGWNYLSPADFHAKTGGQFILARLTLDQAPPGLTPEQAELLAQVRITSQRDQEEATRTRRPQPGWEESPLAVTERRARAEAAARRSAEIDELLDDPVFGRQVTSGTHFGR